MPRGWFSPLALFPFLRSSIVWLVLAGREVVIVIRPLTLSHSWGGGGVVLVFSFNKASFCSKQYYWSHCHNHLFYILLLWRKLYIFFPVCCLGRNRQSGDQNNISDKDQKNNGIVSNNDRNAGESGRGRGSREDRWNDRKPGGRGLHAFLMTIFQPRYSILMFHWKLARS